MTVMTELAAGALKLGLDLSPLQLAQFQSYYRELVDWNRRVNLTAITDYREVQLKHFLDALTVTIAFPPAAGGPGPRLIDVGTGAGLPGLPVKIVFPGMRLVLLEATAKKAVFLDYLIQKLGLEGVEIVVGRAETVARQGPYREGFDLVLSRGVAPLPVLAELTLPFITPGGCLVAQKKGDTAAEIAAAGRAISLLGGRLREVRAVDLAELADRRHLVIVDKIAPTPPAYPRRPGMPAKKPL